MSPSEQDSTKHLLTRSAEVIAIALAYALTITFAGWLWVGTQSPFNHGTSPNVQARPSVTLWVIANFPAAILFINAFGKNGPEYGYFLCVFLQWFLIGLPVGALIAAVRRARSHGRITPG